MPRENARTRGMRYLAEGRLWVRHIGPDRVEALCRGSGEIHHLGWDADRGWWCSCPAFQRCAHLWALETCTTRPGTATI